MISASKPKSVICKPVKMSKTERIAAAKRVTMPVLIYSISMDVP